MAHAVYPTGVTTTSATRTDLAADYGAVRYYKGNYYRLFKAGESLAAGAICMISAIDGTSAGAEGTIGETVVVTTGPKVQARCANDTGSAVTSGHYFWGLTEGYVVLTGGGSVAAGDTIMPNAAGAVQTFAEASSALGNHACGIALEEDAAVTYAVTCFFQAGFNHDVNA